MTRDRRPLGAILLPGLFLLLQSSAFPQGRIPVEFRSASSRNSSVAALRSGGYLYASLNDLARVFDLGTFENAASGKYEIKAGLFRVRITADNPYVVVRDEELNSNVYQLPAPSLYLTGRYYVPVAAMCSILDYILAADIAFDGSAPKIVAGGRPASSSAFDLAGLEFEEKSNGLMIRLKCTRNIPDYESWLKEIGSDTWLYVTLANVRADVRAINAIQPSGPLRKILVFQSATSVQLTFRIRGKVGTADLMGAEGSNDILVTVHTPTAEEIAARKSRSFEQTLQREKDRWKLDVIVIDAGHGGHDPGTIGINHTREKDVALSIAEKLGNLIKKNLPDVKVVYTRDRDVFVELYRRGQIANESNGKLFISIHCNSMPKKPNPTNGFEIYLLRPGKTEAAIRVAEKENAVVKMEEGYEKRYKELTEENFILLSMAQISHAKHSERFAEILQQEMGKRLQLENNGVKQAGFFVLWGASMPHAYIETGYLSNRKDERYLRSASGQREIAGTIFAGVKRYKSEYEKSLRGGDDTESR
ncbi:MAG TPA: N-acetylmuramoyl-L-alanine amidase [Bacteroidota bacterium]|nr:N-acetylmuramoyl-L-alanine amidase [Bacteroidota bacterium]